MKIRTSIFCFLLIFACAGILLSRLDSQSVYDTSGVRGSFDRDNGEDTAGGREDPQGSGNGMQDGSAAKKEARCTIVIDAGHGGNDPGKVGVNGANEKDINLKIALLLKQYLTSQNINVIMTRDSDTGLYSENAKNKKAEDMKNRVALIKECGADFLVSIHQNSYTEEKYSGAQVFYYTGSMEGGEMAKAVQARLIAEADPQNHREAKENSDYYLLKKSPVPAIICECGFLSNPAECEKLCTEEYQIKIASGIFQGIMDYLDGQ